MIEVHTLNSNVCCRLCVLVFVMFVLDNETERLNRKKDNSPLIKRHRRCSSDHTDNVLFVNSVYLGHNYASR